MFDFWNKAFFAYRASQYFNSQNIPYSQVLGVDKLEIFLIFEELAAGWNFTPPKIQWVILKVVKVSLVGNVFVICLINLILFDVLVGSIVSLWFIVEHLTV